MSETIYLNVQQSSAIQRPVVRIDDVAEVFCENKSVKNQVQNSAGGYNIVHTAPFLRSYSYSDLAADGKISLYGFGNAHI